MTNKEWMSTLPAEQFYDKMMWLIKDYGMQFNNTRLAVIAWFNEPHEVEPTQNKTSNALNNDAMRWIPVTERLPEEDGKYLTVYWLGTIPNTPWIKTAFFAKNLRNVDKYDFPMKKSGFYDSHSDYGYFEITGITHWMPLPDPPKEE